METVLHVLDTENNGTAQERDCKRERVPLFVIPSLRNTIPPLLVLDEWRKRKPATLSSPALSPAALVASVLITMLALVRAASLAMPYGILSRHTVCWRSEVIP